MTAPHDTPEAVEARCDTALRHCNFLWATGNDDNSAEVIKPLVEMIKRLHQRAVDAERACDERVQDMEAMADACTDIAKQRDEARANALREAADAYKHGIGAILALIPKEKPNAE